MVTLIHGEDTVAGRKALDDLKNKYPESEKVLLDGSKVSLTDIITATDSLSLFGAEKLIIIENLLSGVFSKEKEIVLSYLLDSKSTAEIVLWEQKEIGKTIINKYFKGAKIIYCHPPAVLFKFLDSIGGAPLNDILSMFHKLKKDQEAEFILSMLIRQWRYLIIASDLGREGFAGMPSWQAYKFQSQTKYFNLEALISSYRQLLSIDMKAKSGLIPLSVDQQLDIFFASLYYQN